MLTHHRIRALRLALIVPAAVALSGCDYWPPDLHKRIDSLGAELQASAQERDKLQSDLAAAQDQNNKLQASIRDLNASVEQKNQMIETLQKDLEEARKPPARGKRK
ncbi:MAG: hypothetical protein AB7Q97_01180 [Gammaproteobacteria bacterium]